MQIVFELVNCIKLFLSTRIRRVREQFRVTISLPWVTANTTTLTACYSYDIWTPERRAMDALTPPFYRRMNAALCTPERRSIDA